MLRKRRKAENSWEIEKLGGAVYDIGSNTDSIIDIMAIVQNMVVEYKKI